MDIKVLLGEKIKSLRKKNKMTQQRLAEMIDLDQRNVSNIERGINFSSKSLKKIADVFNISIQELFDFEHLELNEDNMKDYIKIKLENLSKRDLTIIYKMVKFMNS